MKDCLIVGNTNAAAYKEIFPLIKEKKLWLGNNKITDFNTGAGEIKGVYATWYSTFPVTRKPLILTATYSPDKYPVYDNYNAINVDKVCDIPMDYDGIMGVSISFLDKYCPEQFEIVGLGIANLGLECGVRPYLPEHKFYRKYVQKRGTFDGDLYLLDNNGHPVVPYARILIRKRK